MSDYEHCMECDGLTGRAGSADDSLYHGYIGPFCENCYEDWPDKVVAEIATLRKQLAESQARVAELEAARSQREPFAWCFTDVNGRASELVYGPAIEDNPDDMRVVTPLYTNSAQPADGGEWVSCADRLPTEADANKHGMVRWRRSGIGCNGLWSDVPIDADAWHSLAAPQPPKREEADNES